MWSRSCLVCLVVVVLMTATSPAQAPPETMGGLDGACRRMLNLQIAVSNRTLDLHEETESRGVKKPLPEDRKECRKLAASEQPIIKEVTQVIDDIMAGGGAVAFAEVFQQLRDDMKQVQRRLDAGDVGKATQDLEKDIIATLQEMLTALKK
jgi:hypothetical protein